MELFGKIILILHIIAGSLTLITGPVAIFYNFKEPRKHRAFGKVFYYAMLIVVATSVSGLIKHPDSPFYQFLVGISILVLCGILRGIRSIYLMKGGAVTRFEWTYTIVLAINGLWMLGMAVFHVSAGTIAPIPILFSIFGLMSVTDVRQNWRIFSRPQRLHRLDWLRLHTNTMLGAFTASTTAFTVNAAQFLPWWAQWFGPTLLIMPLHFYFGGKLGAMRGKTASAAGEAN